MHPTANTRSVIDSCRLAQLCVRRVMRGVGEKLLDQVELGPFFVMMKRNNQHVD